MIDEPYVRAWLREGLPARDMPGPQLRERIHSALIEQPRPGADRARHAAAGGLALVFGMLMIAVLIGIRLIGVLDHPSPANTAPAHTQIPSPRPSAPTDTPAPKVSESPPPKVCTVPASDVCVPPPPKVSEAPGAQASSHGSVP